MIALMTTIRKNITGNHNVSKTTKRKKMMYNNQIKIIRIVIRKKGVRQTDNIQLGNSQQRGRRCTGNSEEEKSRTDR